MSDHPSDSDSAANPFPIKRLRELIDPFVVPPAQKISLAKDYDPGFKATYLEKSDSESDLEAAIQALATYQDMLYAQDTHALLIIFQAMDAAGKDSTIKHVMSGINPQGCQVHNFKTPSVEDLNHGYLWRCTKVLPRKGQICIFNRSYYEDVLVTRVHPELLHERQLPPGLIDAEIWERRYDEIKAFEDYLINNGTIVIKFFLNVF